MPVPPQDPPHPVNDKTEKHMVHGVGQAERGREGITKQVEQNLSSLTWVLARKMLMYTGGHRLSLPTLKITGRCDSRGRSRPSYQTQPSAPPPQLPLCPSNVAAMTFILPTA